MDMKNSKRVIYPLVFVSILVLTLFLTACTTKTTEDTSDAYTKAEVDSLLAQAEANGYANGAGSVDITADNQAAIDQYAASMPATEEDVATEDTSATDTSAEEDSMATADYTTDLYLGDTVDVNLDDNDIDQLFDGSVDFDGDSIDTRETVVLNTDVQVAYSGDSAYDEDLAGEPYVVGLAREAVQYMYSFDDAVALSDIDDDTPLEISFLGERMSIIGADFGEITYFAKPSQYVHIGDSITVDGESLTLKDVSTDSVVVEANGEIEVVEEGNTETVGGVRVYVESTFSRDNRDESAAVLVVGEGSKQTVQDGDYFDDSESWVWVIEDDGTNLLNVGLAYNERFYKPSGDVEPLAVGDCISYPWDYAKVCFTSTNEPDYQQVNVGFDEIDIASVNTKVTTVEFKDDVLELDGRNWKTAYTDGTSWYYKDGSDYVAATDITGTIDLSDADYLLDFGSNGEIYITDEIGDWYSISADALNERLGSLSDEAESTDVLYNGNPIGERDQDVLTAFGTKIGEPQSNAEQDEAVLWLPEDRLEVELGFY